MARRILFATTCILAIAVGCSRTEGPASPSSLTSDSGANADGSRLKITAPVPQSPAPGSQPEGTVTLVASPAAGKFMEVSGLTYRFEVYSAANTRVCQGVVGSTGGNVSFTLSDSVCTLNFDEVHTWRVRGQLSDDRAGPWSATSNFKAPVGGYIRGNEVYDPLYNGRTAATAMRDVTFMPGQGIRLNSRDSYVEYRLQQPLVDGEFSAEMTNIGNGSEEWKTKVMSMLQGDGVNTTDNDFRVTIDKRTQWVGQGSRIRYTMRSNGNDAGEPRGGDQNWNRSFVYFWEFTWRDGTSRLVVKENGRNGRVMEVLGVEYDAPYQPDPHLVRLGSVGGRAENETNPGTIIRNVWVSSRPRPLLPGETR